MAIADDFSVSASGDIRYVGSGPTYTVIAFHRWLGDLMDDAQAAGNDILDITDATASERATDNLITLNAPYNIDDYTARFLFDGSIVQDGGNTIYDGIVCFAPTNTYLQIIQNGKVLSPNFWTTGYNADTVQGISHRFMVKVRSAGADIDGRRLIGQTREVGKTFSEFRINGTSRGNNVLALQFSDDLNNATVESVIKGWSTISNTEGYRLIDVNNDTVNEAYYSEWNRATFTINQLYERAKYLSRRGTVEASCADVGSNFAVGNGTITRQGQSFANGSNPQFLVRAYFQLQKVLNPTGTVTATLYAHGGTFGSSSVGTGAALATSDAVSLTSLTTSYSTVEFTFSTPFEMLANTNYVIAVEYSGGNGTNYINVRGLAGTGTHAGNRSQWTGAAWAATATDDLNFSLQTSHKLYTVPGELFRGITHELTMTTPRSGTFSAVERITWPGGGSGILMAVDTPAASTKMWIQVLTGVAPTTGQLITGITSAATGTTTGAPVERSLSYPFIGASTGSALIGGYGVGVEYSDLTASDKLFDLTNTQRVPPNNVTFTVQGLVIGEDRVLVGPGSGGNLLANQLLLQTTLNGAAVTSVVVQSAIPSDTPASGTIRVRLNSGVYRRVPYTSFSGSTFTIGSTDFSADPATAGTDVFISYIDKLAAATSESFTVVYNVDRSLFVRVRDGGGTPIKTFETTGTLGSAGGSATAIRTSDA